MKLAELNVGGSVVPWESLGFQSEVDDPAVLETDSLIRVAEVVLRFSSARTFGPAGLAGWSFVDASEPRTSTTSIDGIPTRIGVDGPTVLPAVDRLGVTGVDHVVVMTGSLERTCAAITETTGDPLRRIRDAGGGVRQGFHRAGSVILEVVERPDLDPGTPASLWGLVFVVADLDGAVAWLGPDVIGPPRDAVQPGRRIATIRSEAGLGVPVALMTPHE